MKQLHEYIRIKLKCKNYIHKRLGLGCRNLNTCFEFLIKNKKIY